MDGLDSGATLDAFHRGAFHLVQPARRGHRAGTDALMLAAAVPSGFAGRLADLGAGAGAAGLAVLARCPEAHALLVENSSEMAGFARRTLAHPANAALAPRCAVLEADVTLADAARRNAGLPDFAFDFAILNPPFNPPADRPSPDALRRSAHVMEDEGLFDAWLKTAGWIVKPGGGVAVIARPQSLPAILAAMRPYFGRAEVKPLHPRADKPAIRIVVRARRGDSRPLELAPPLVLHQPEGRFTAEAEAINAGTGSLFGD